MNIAVLGRGISLNNFIELPEVDQYIICNEFSAEITQNPYLKNCLIQKPTRHVVNRHILTVKQMLMDNRYNDLNIIEMVQPYIEEMKCMHGGSCHCAFYKNGYFNPTPDIKIPTTGLNDIHKDFMYKSGEIKHHPGNKYPYFYPSAGIAAIAYATINLKPKNLYLIGFDFHTGGYASGEAMNPTNETFGQKEMVSKLISKHLDTNFHLYTLSEFPFEHTNLKVHQVKKYQKPMTKNKKLAVVIGGWHYPYEYYKQLKNQTVPDGWEIDFYVVSHRDPELPIVFEEKQPLLESRGEGILQSFDKALYSRIITKNEIKELGFTYNEEKSAIGDLYQLNQWVQRHYRGQYDKVLFTHDDNYLLTHTLFTDILEYKADIFLSEENNQITPLPKKFDWKHLSSGVLENTVTPRTSFTFLDKELLDKLKDDLEEITTKGVDLDRTGETSTLYELSGKQVDTKVLGSWNAPSRNFTNWIKDNGYSDKSVRLSPVYRVTKYFIEGERGFMWTERDEGRIIKNLAQYYDLGI
tara:strand:+ start:1640 stop:3208 length:1569 start_codon:yes stop_codon:yes gene_type:complete